MSLTVKSVNIHKRLVLSAMFHISFGSSFARKKSQRLRNWW